MSEARLHSDRWADKWQDMAAGGGLGKFTILGGIDSRLDDQLVTGKPAKGYTSHCSFDKLSCRRCSNLRFQTITRWGRASMVSHISRVYVKQGLIQQRMDRERTAVLDCLIIYREIWFQFFSVDSSFHILLI